jgi:tRNA pseudouridine13 synthase
MPEPSLQLIYEEVLREQGIKRSMFNALKLRQAFYKSSARRLLLDCGPVVSATGEDELNPGFYFLRLGFALPRGSYATLLIKRIFLENRSAGQRKGQYS